MGQSAVLHPVPAPAVLAEDVDEADVYTTEDTDISPQVMDARVMPSNAPGNGPRTVNRIALVIGADGRVEQVKMLSRLERLSDLMLLSSAKHWILRPAMKDGRPVRYLLPVTWTANLQ